MSSFRVALIDRDVEQIPEWVAPALTDAGIDFAHGNCADDDEMLALAQGCNVLWIYGGCRLATGRNLARLESCMAAIRSGSGVDQIDVEAATELGMVVVNTPHAHDDAVSDHTIALIFAVGRQIARQDRLLRDAEWAESARCLPLWKLRGNTLGLIGFGNIPRALVRKLAGFELDVLVFDPFVDPQIPADYGVRSVPLQTLLEQSDIVSIHTPLTTATHHLIDADALARMKPGAMLINTARGPIVDEAALAHALHRGHLAGAGLDVFEEEPPAADNPLLTLDTVVVTPHIAGISDVSIDLTWRLSVEACIDLMEGYFPRSYVNRDVTPRRPLRPSRRHNEPI